MPSHDNLIIKCICFDLDGVLLDSWELMNESFVAACIRSNVQPIPAIEKFRKELGRPLCEISAELTLPEEFAQCYEEYSLENQHTLAPFKGANDLLCRLYECVPLAINTGKSRQRTDALLKMLGWSPYFRAVVCGDEVEHGKPHPESLLRVAGSCGVLPVELAFVGDMPVDMMCARAVDAVGIAASWGCSSREELASSPAVFHVDDFESLRNLLDSLTGTS